MDKVSVSHLLAFSRYKTKFVIKFLLRQLMISQTLGFFLGQPLKQWLTAGKRGEDKNTKIWISQEQRELLWWKKAFFIAFKGLWKINKLVFTKIS